MCQMCHNIVDTINHLFVGCSELLDLMSILLFGGMCIFLIRFLFSAYFLGQTLFR